MVQKQHSSAAYHKYLQLLAGKFPNLRAVHSEIINLEAILNLPKGTEHFLSDIHGEYETFKHLLSNSSGVIRRRIDDIFGDRMSEEEKNRFAMLIYYPRGTLDTRHAQGEISHEWYRANLLRMIEVGIYFTSKYTRSKVMKALPPDFGYIINELVNMNKKYRNKEVYFQAIVDSIINNQTADEFLFDLAHLIQHLSIDRLHIVGDIYDRGPYPDRVMDELMKIKNVDIQWGNHDVIWMGAAAGMEVYIAIVLRISARYNNLDILENAYGISLYSLYEFAHEVYSDDPCLQFTPKNADSLSSKQLDMMKKVHKAISIIQFKLEGQIIRRNPQFKMDDRLLLGAIDPDRKGVKVGGRQYKLLDRRFDTVDPGQPYTLTDGERELMMKLKRSFKQSEKLQKHINYLYAKGSMYLKVNDLLLYHGAIPMTSNGNFKSLEIQGKKYKGKALLDRFDELARKAYYDPDNTLAQDYLWYLWCGPDSPLFGKKKMATFERYFIKAKGTHKEERKAYYKLREDEKVLEKILDNFGLSKQRGRVVNGHVPVKVVKGESPTKAGGRLIVIDGGMSRPYQPVTGLAGFTLISNSFGLVLVSHKPFQGRKLAIETAGDIISEYRYLDPKAERKTISQTDVGKQLREQIDDLKQLARAFKDGRIKEKSFE